MGVEKEGGAAWVVVGVDGPDVVVEAVGGVMVVVFDGVLEHVGDGCLLAAVAGDCDHLLEQVYGLGRVCHIVGFMVFCPKLVIFACF